MRARAGSKPKRFGEGIAAGTVPGGREGPSGTGQLARHGAGAHGGAPAAVLASLSPAPSSLFVNNGAEKIAAETPLGSALCCLNASSLEVPARRRHKGCWEGRKGQGGLVR